MIRPLASVPIWPRCTSAERLQRVSWFAGDGVTFLTDCALRNGRLEIPSITPSSSHAGRRTRRKTGRPAPDWELSFTTELRNDRSSRKRFLRGLADVTVSLRTCQWPGPLQGRLPPVSDLVRSVRRDTGTFERSWTSKVNRYLVANSDAGEK